jgi:hypothetical protein
MYVLFSLDVTNNLDFYSASLPFGFCLTKTGALALSLFDGAGASVILKKSKLNGTVTNKKEKK